MLTVTITFEKLNLIIPTQVDDFQKVCDDLNLLPVDALQALARKFPKGLSFVDENLPENTQRALHLPESAIQTLQDAFTLLNQAFAKATHTAGYTVDLQPRVDWNEGPFIRVRFAVALAPPITAHRNLFEIRQIPIYQTQAEWDEESRVTGIV